MNRVIELADVPVVVGQTSQVRAECGCRMHQGRLPLFRVERTVSLLRELLEAGLAARPDLLLDPSAPIETYRCRKCQGVVVVTLEALGLASCG